MNFEKIVIAIDLNEASLQNLAQIKDFTFPIGSEIHLVHVFELNLMSFDFIPNLQPSDEDYLLIQKLIEERLKVIKSNLGLNNHKNVILKCLFSPNAKQEFLGYADSVHASLIIAGTKEREGIIGFFESSFTSFLNKFSNANLLILRTQK
jgi:hypothetical protein